jgi:hypothetical protein
MAVLSPIVELVHWTFVVALMPLAMGVIRDSLRARREAGKLAESDIERPDVADLRRTSHGRRRRRRRASPRRRERVAGR